MICYTLWSLLVLLGLLFVTWPNSKVPNAAAAIAGPLAPSGYASDAARGTLADSCRARGPGAPLPPSFAGAAGRVLTGDEFDVIVSHVPANPSCLP